MITQEAHKMRSGKEPVTTIIVLIIILAAAGMLIYWSTFKAFPAAQGALACDVIGRLTGGCSVSTIGIGNIGNPTTLICFSIEAGTETTDTLRCIRKETGGVALRLFTSHQVAKPDPILTPNAMYLGFERNICKYSKLGKEWCTKLNKKNVVAVGADDNFACGIFEDKDKTLICLDSNNGKEIFRLEKQSLRGKPAIFDRKVYVTANDYLYSFDLSNINGKKKGKLNEGTKLGRALILSVPNISFLRGAPFVSEDTNLCYSTVTTQTGAQGQAYDLSTMRCADNAVGKSFTISGINTEALAVLGDEVVGTENLGAARIIFLVKKSRAVEGDKRTTKIIQYLTRHAGEAPNAIQDGKYVCYYSFQETNPVTCKDKSDLSRSVTINKVYGDAITLGYDFIDDGTLFANTGNGICAIEIDGAIGRTITVPSTDAAVKWCVDYSTLPIAGIHNIIGLPSSQERPTSAPLIGGGEEAAGQEATPEDQEGPALPKPGGG